MTAIITDAEWQKHNYSTADGYKHKQWLPRGARCAGCHTLIRATPRYKGALNYACELINRSGVLYRFLLCGECYKKNDDAKSLPPADKERLVDEMHRWGWRGNCEFDRNKFVCARCDKQFDRHHANAWECDECGDCVCYHCRPDDRCCYNLECDGVVKRQPKEKM